MKGLRVAGAAAVMLLLGSPSTVAAARQANPTATPAKAAAAAAVPNGSWTVYHHDDAHTGFDSTQPPATGASTGWVSTALDQSIYAEPLVYNGIVYAATLNNTVYALDQSTGAVIWSTHLRAPKTSGWGCGNVSPQGILGTPVIDAAGGRVYVATLGADSIYRLEGLNLATGASELTTVITSPAPTFDWTIEQERGALALANGYVYVPFGGRAGDCGAYHGWVFAVPTNGGAVTNFYVTPGQGAGFWAAGGVVVDSSTGKVFETSGNGTASGCNANSNRTPVFENDAVVRLSATLAHEDAFIPNDWRANWCLNDQDLGSATMVLISPTLAFQSGKWGSGFLLNPQALGGMNGQLYPSPTNYTGVDVCRADHNDANFGSYAYAAPYVYLSCESNGLVALQMNTTTKSFSACGSTCAPPSWNTGGFSPGPPIVAGGAVWAVDTGGGGLYGFDASTGAQIYHSSGFGVTHFTTPSEAGGQIFVGSGAVVRSFNMTSGCSSVTLAAAPPSSAAAGSTVTLTATASGAACTTPQYQFWMRPSAGSWTMLRDYTGTNTFSWTSTTPSGTYFLGARAKDLASTVPFESTASIPYTLTPAPCTAVTLSAAPPAPQLSGTQVTLTAIGTCPNPNPLYEFWAKWQGSSTWQALQAYSTSNVYQWNSTGALAGTEAFGVWVHDASSSAPFPPSPSPACCWDALTSIPYSVNTPSCATVTVSPMPTTVMHGAGTHVTITGVAAGCTNSPLYEFWMRAASQSTWQLVQSYTPSATYDWNSTGALAGTVYFGVWVKDASSPNTYDVFASTNVGVT